jgi:hypothetical protein
MAIYLNLKYEAESGATRSNSPSSANGADAKNIILATGANYSIDSHHSIDVSY